MCDYGNASNVVKEAIDLLAAATNNYDRAHKDVAFKNNVPVRSCISEINIILVAKVEDLDTVMPINNLLEYSNNYSIISVSLWYYYGDTIVDADDNASQGKLFKARYIHTYI